MTCLALEDRVLPLSEFPVDMRERIEVLAGAPEPPARFIFLGHPEDPFPQAMIESRAFYEWHRQHGRDIRDRGPRSRVPRRMRAAVIERDCGICQLCGEAVGDEDIHIDHIRPVAYGGKTTLDNLQLAHAHCNVRKGARWPA